MQCQPCDSPNPTQTNPIFEKGAPHPTRGRGARRLATRGSSPTRNADDTTRAIRGTRAFKAITTVKASTRARGNPKTPTPQPIDPLPPDSSLGWLGHSDPGTTHMGLKDPVNTLVTLPPLHLGPRDPTPTPDPEIPPPVSSNRTGLAMPSTHLNLGKGSCQDNSNPAVVAVVHQTALPPQNLDIPFQTMEWNGPVAGRLSKFIHNWKLITTDPWVLSIIQGHHIEFLQQTRCHHPPPMYYSNKEETGHLRRGDQDAVERGHHSSSPEFTRGVLHVQLVFSTEERRGHETSNKPEGSQPICANRALQDGRTAPTQHRGQTGRLIHKGRSQGCVLPHASPPEPSVIPEFLMGGENVPIYLPHIWISLSSKDIHKGDETSPCMPAWISLSSKDIHKGDETSPCMPAAIGCTVHNVPGRSTDHGNVSGGDTPSDSQYTCAVPGPRLLDKLREVNPVATAGDCIPRPCCELNNLDIVLASSEIARPVQGDSIPVEQGGSVGLPAGSHCGETQLHGLSRTACSAPLQGASEPENLLSTRDGIVRCPDNSVTSSQG